MSISKEKSGNNQVRMSFSPTLLLRSRRLLGLQGAASLGLRGSFLDDKVFDKVAAAPSAISGDSSGGPARPLRLAGAGGWGSSGPVDAEGPCGCGRKSISPMLCDVLRERD